MVSPTQAATATLTQNVSCTQDGVASQFRSQAPITFARIYIFWCALAGEIYEIIAQLIATHTIRYHVRQSRSLRMCRALRSKGVASQNRGRIFSWNNYHIFWNCTFWTSKEADWIEKFEGRSIFDQVTCVGVSVSVW